MKFKLSRKSHTEARSNDKSFLGKLRKVRDTLSNTLRRNSRNLKVGIGLFAALAGSMGAMPATARAAEITDTTSQSAITQTLDDSYISEDDIDQAISAAVEASTPQTQEVAEQAPVQETTEVVAETPQVQETQEAAEQAPVQETEQNTQQAGEIVDDSAVIIDNEAEANNVVDSYQVYDHGDYQVIYQDGQLILLGNIPEDQLSTVAEDLIQQFGEEAVQNIIGFNDLDSQMENGETVSLGGTDFSATKNDDGTISITDTNGQVILTLASQMTNENTQEASQETNNVENMDERVIQVSEDEYLVYQNSDGSYSIALGGVGLSNNQIQDLISKLQAEGLIPADAQVTFGVLPTVPTAEQQANGITEKTVKIGDVEYTIDASGNLVAKGDGSVLDGTIKDALEQLQENYETSKDPDATPGNKASKDEPGDEIPGDKPKEDKPKEEIPKEEQETPVQETPEVKEETPVEEVQQPTKEGEIYQTGVDMQAPIALGAAAAGLAGAAVVAHKMSKRKEDGEEETEEDEKTTSVDTKMDEFDDVMDDSKSTEQERATVINSTLGGAYDDVEKAANDASLDKQVDRMINEIYNNVYGTDHNYKAEAEKNVVTQRLASYAESEKYINDNPNLTKEEKDELRNQLYKDFDDYVEKHPEKTSKGRTK